MKKVINTVLIVLVALVGVLPLSSCVSNREIDADASTVTIVLEVKTVKVSDFPLSLPYKIHNTSSKVVTVEPHYEVERYDGTKWTSFPFNADDPPNWPEGNSQLEPDTSIDESLIFWSFAEEIAPGTYRIVKEVAEDDKPPFMLYAEFEVVE